MSWVKLDDGFFRNAKAIAAGRDGRAMYLAGLCFCAAGETDGKIAAEAVRIIAADADVPAKTADKLVAVGLWRREGHQYDVPDYLLYNPSRSQAVAARQAAKSRQQSRRESRRDIERSSRSPSRPPGITSSSSSSPSTGAAVDDDEESVIEQALGLFADRKLAGANGSVQSPGPWRQKVLANARAELASQARQWFHDYDVTASQLADGLLAGGVPASWAYARRVS